MMNLDVALQDLTPIFAQDNYRLAVSQLIQGSLGIYAMKKLENLSKAEVAVKARDLQLELKNVSKSMQELRTGRYEKSTLKELEYKPETTKSFIIEAARRDESGAVISEARVITSETFTKAAEGMLKQEGTEVGYQACFAAGTLVHTDKGLVPIEQVRVGTRVLSQPELGGGRDYRRVTNTIATLDQFVFGLQIKPISSDVSRDAPHPSLASDLLATTLLTTPGHPFWVETLTPAQRAKAGVQTVASAPPQAGDFAKHWLAVEELEVGQILQLADGSRASVQATGIVYKTQHADLCVVVNDAAATGIILSLPADLTDINAPIVPASAERLNALDPAEPLKMTVPLKRTVYNLTVDEFHTYYVAGIGVWVHNTYGGPEAISRQLAAENLKSVCFAYDTKVIGKSLHGRSPEGVNCVDIGQIQVGDLVLSRCEKTGELLYKKVIRTYENSTHDMFTVDYQAGLDAHNYGVEAIGTTGDHPFWVEGKGWIKTRDLQKDDQFLTYDGRRAKVYSVEAFGYDVDFEDGYTVYNIEVEDLNTYFVSPHGIWVHNCNESVEVKPLDLNANPNALPLTAPGSRLLAGELSAQTKLAKADLVSVALRDSLSPETFALRNQLGKEARNSDGSPIYIDGYGNSVPAEQAMGIKYAGNPDLVFDKTGKVADIYQSVGASGQPASLQTIREQISKKAQNQASTIVLDLSLSGREASEVLARINKSDEVKADGTKRFEPPSRLLELIIIDKNGDIFTVKYAETPANKPVFGQVDLATGATIRWDSAQPQGTPIILNRRVEATAQGSNAQTQALNLPAIDSVLTAARQYWLTAGASGASEAALANVQINIDNLPARVAAQTVGHQITLSADGAGWGWFVDTTPSAQEEFGLGNSLTAFTATSGTVAEGKLDLLTVLVHELGHVLGLAHTDEGASTTSDADADAQNDVMAQFLTPGVRRIPSAHDAALLVQQGAHRPASGNSATRVVYTSTVAQQALPRSVYLTALNSTLANGNFASGANSLTGWESAGAVQAVANTSGSTITLGESTTAQAHLAQAFLITPQDRFLTFTVSGLALQTNSIEQNGVFTAAPQDAFEVALQNANTGANLLATGSGAGVSNLGTSRSDALLNLQLASSSAAATLQERAVSGLRHTDNADGSRTYLLDLSGIAAGTAVNLSFDLIGFGLTSSQLGSKSTSVTCA